MYGNGFVFGFVLELGLAYGFVSFVALHCVA